MNKFHGLYLEGKLNMLIVSVHPLHRAKVKQAIELLPYVDEVHLREGATQIMVFLSRLSTKEDLKVLERTCRAIVGAEEENQESEDA